MADANHGGKNKELKRRHWPYVAFGLVVLVVLYLVIFLPPDPRLTLDYLKALIWPALLAVVLYWLREPLRQKVAQLSNAELFGQKLGFDNQQIQAAVTGLAATFFSGSKDSESERPKAEPDTAGVAHETGEDRRRQEKQAIEEIMRASAWWGYDAAKRGFPRRPTPVVMWTKDDRPLIQSVRDEPGQILFMPDAAWRDEHGSKSHRQEAGGNP